MAYYVQSVDARWRHGAEWSVQVRWRLLNDDDEDVRRGWKQLTVSSEATSSIIDNLTADRQYLVVVNARNEVGYNTSLTPEPVVIPGSETSKCSPVTDLMGSAGHIACNSSQNFEIYQYTIPSLLSN